jgi:hypothetical protein
MNSSISANPGADFLRPGMIVLATSRRGLFVKRPRRSVETIRALDYQSARGDRRLPKANTFSAALFLKPASKATLG